MKKRIAAMVVVWAIFMGVALGVPVALNPVLRVLLLAVSCVLIAAVTLIPMRELAWLRGWSLLRVITDFGPSTYVLPGEKRHRQVAYVGALMGVLLGSAIAAFGLFGCPFGLVLQLHFIVAGIIIALFFGAVAWVMGS